MRPHNPNNALKVQEVDELQDDPSYGIRLKTTKAMINTNLRELPD